MIRNNWQYKLLSLVVACTLWTYVQAERNPQLQRTFTVSLSGGTKLARGYEAEMRTLQVTIMVRGAKAVVESISPRDVSALVNLAGYRAGRDIPVPVRANVSGLSEDDRSAIEISVVPQTIKVSIEATTEKRLPIEVKLLAAPPLGYAYGSPEIDPASVRVMGKASEVARVRRVVLPLSGSIPGGTVDDVFDLTPVDSAGSEISDVQLDPPSVRLRVQLVEVPATKAVLVSAGITGSPKYPASVKKVTVTPPTVVLEGRPAILNTISTVSTEKVSIDDADGPVNRDVALRIPPNVRIVSHNRVRVEIDIGTP